MKKILSIFLLFLASLSVSEDDSWTKYSVTLNYAKIMPKRQYEPPHQDNCNALFYSLAMITYEKGFDIKFFPNEILRQTFFPEESVTIKIYGVTAPMLRIVFINDSVKSCGKARNLAHELGHVASLDVDEEYSEIVAELIQFGLLDAIYKNRSFDIEQSTALYLSVFQDDSDRSININRITGKQLDVIKAAVLNGVNRLLEGEK